LPYKLLLAASANGAWISEYKANERTPSILRRNEGKSRPFPPLGGIDARFVLFRSRLGEIDDDAVKEINPDFDALLAFLANWEAIERSTLGRILTAGQLADVLELERIFALPSGTPEDSQ
jgi:hypothetical protein